MRRLPALDIISLNGRVLEEHRVGDTPYISKYAQFDWYGWVKYYDPAETGDKKAKSKLGSFCGVKECRTKLYILDPDSESYIDSEVNGATCLMNIGGILLGRNKW